MPILLSLSIDGKYCESNRPVAFKRHDPLSGEYLFETTDEEVQSDEFYERLFAYAGAHPDPVDPYVAQCLACAPVGFHPMVYSHRIEWWRENFLWFQEMFQKYGIPWTNIYLLEVRNPEWSYDQILQLGEFMRFLVRWALKRVGSEGELIRFIIRNGFNILRMPFTGVGRGLGCSLQAMLYLRLADLAWIPCHRQCYPGREYAHLRFERRGGRLELELEPRRVEAAIGEYSMDADQWPYCRTCPLKYSCAHGCLGAQLEAHGEPLTPIPTVCALEHWKVYSIVDELQRLGVWWELAELVSPPIRAGAEAVMELARSVLDKLELGVK